MNAHGKPAQTREAGKNGMRAGIKCQHVGIEIEAVGDKLYVFTTSGRNGCGDVACIAIVTDTGAPALDRKVNLNPFGEFTPAELGETVATIGDPCEMLPVRYIVEPLDGDCTEWDEPCAYFPTLSAGDSLITCYMHTGQHSGADPDYFKHHRAATPAEYAELHAELTGIYDDVILQVEAHNKS